MTRPSWPYLPQFLPRLQHIFLPHPRGKCLSTDCPVVIIDSVTCVNYASSLGMFFHQLSSRHWWCGDMCQSCVYIGSVCSLIVYSWMMIHWRVSHVSTLGVSVHWLSSRQWWSTDMFQSSVYIGNGKFTDCPVIINDLVTCVSHVSTLGMASSPTVQSLFMI